MEGVLVSAQAAGSPITVTVVSDEHGRFRFPDARLAPGHYALRIRAIGYELDGSQAVDLGAATTEVALKLRKTVRSCGATDQYRMVHEHARHAGAEAAADRMHELSHL